MTPNTATVEALSESPIHRYEALLYASSAIASCREDGRAVIKRFADELRKFVTFDYVLISVIDPNTGETRWKSFQAHGVEEHLDLPVLQPHETPSGKAYEIQQPIVIPDWDTESKYPKLREYLRQF